MSRGSSERPSLSHTSTGALKNLSIRSVEAAARAAGFGGRVEFPGWLAEPERALAGCDVVVFPSRWQEPFGLSGAEAAAHGKAVAAFDVGGVREWLDDGVNGFLVPEKDTAALAEKLELLYREPEARSRMGKAGITLVKERFSEAGFLRGFRRLLDGEEAVG